MMKKTSLYKALLLGLLATTVSACGAGGKGLDRELDMRTLQTLGESCGKAYAEMRSANTKEYVALKDTGAPVFDLSQPRDQVQFQHTAGPLCRAWAKEARRAAEKDNLHLKTIREIWAWIEKTSIDEDAKHYERYLTQYRSKTGACDEREKSRATAMYQGMCIQHFRDNIERIQSSQRRYETLTGKKHGPQKLQAPD